MKTIDVKGKPYVEVNERLKEFRTNEKYKGYRLVSVIVELDNGICTMRAEIYNDNDKLVAVGHAQEKENSTFINKTSYIENCETSAWGRALGNLGIGIDTSVASAEEVLNASLNQEEKPKAKKTKLAEEDKEFYEVIELMETEKDLKEYYKSTFQQVKDKKAYNELVTKRMKEIKGE